MSEEMKTIAKYRLDRANESFRTTEVLLSHDLHAAANRLYYAVFSALRAVLALDGVDFKKHSAVISYFREHYIKTEIFDKEYSLFIGSASQIRTESDYADLYEPDYHELLDMVNELGEFIACIEKYVSEQFELQAKDCSNEN